MKTLILCFLISTLLSTFALSEKCNPQDKKALLQIKKDFGNPYLLASWKSEEDCCTWYQVKCDSTSHRIVSLTIFAGELFGKIPPAVGDLPYLQTLEFHKLTNVTGPIQPTIAKLKSLTFLSLSWLSLTGPIPEFLGTLKKLTFLELSFNSLSGSIPSSLALLPNLDGLYLDRNKLTGSIPTSFGAFRGKVPSIHLSHNQLSDLSRNLLEFDLSKVVFSANLGVLDLNHNKIYGSLPKELAKLISLQRFNVSYNRLCGRVPVGGALQKFESSAYFHNQCLCGSPLPNCK
ncbi:Polygalacturonase inhibitor [Euphorbia peplus]|nr:Polygalacturonase inhibitor [Euphorbia peplus]